MKNLVSEIGQVHAALDLEECGGRGTPVVGERQSLVRRCKIGEIHIKSGAASVAVFGLIAQWGVLHEAGQLRPDHVVDLGGGLTGRQCLINIRSVPDAYRCFYSVDIGPLIAEKLARRRRLENGPRGCGCFRIRPAVSVGGRYEERLHRHLRRR